MPVANFVLGNSVRSVVAAMKQNTDADSVCVVSPSPRAQRRMSGPELIESFDSMGKILTEVQRLEIHFYSSNRVQLPTKALAAFLRGAKRLTYLLMNGMRFSGTVEDMADLGKAFQEHPALHRLCFFNCESLDPECVPMDPLLAAIRLSPVIKDVALRYTSWTNPHLGLICDTHSNLRTLRLTGKDSLGKNGLTLMMDALKTNVSVREFAINQCSPEFGTGEKVGEMLLANPRLEAVVMEISSFLETIPVAKALKVNNTLKKLDLFVVRKSPNMLKESEEAKKEYGVSMEVNTTLIHMVLNTHNSIETTPKIELYLRLNRAGRAKLLSNDDLTHREWLCFVLSFKDDLSMMYYMLSTKPMFLRQFSFRCDGCGGQKLTVPSSTHNKHQLGAPYMGVAAGTRPKKLKLLH